MIIKTLKFPGNVCVSDPEHSTIDPVWLWSGEDLEVPHLHGEMSIITRNFNVVEIREYMNHFHQQYFVSASAFAINPHFQFTRKRTQSTNNINLFLHGIIIVNGWSKYFDYNIASGETPMIHIRVVINVCRKLHWVNTQIHQTLVKLKGKRVSLSWPTSNIRRERRWPSSSTLSNSAPCSTGSPSLNTKQFKFVKVVVCETLCACSIRCDTEN